MREYPYDFLVAVQGENAPVTSARLAGLADNIHFAHNDLFVKKNWQRAAVSPATRRFRAAPLPVLFLFPSYSAKPPGITVRPGFRMSVTRARFSKSPLRRPFAAPSINHSLSSRRRTVRIIRYPFTKPFNPFALTVRGIHPHGSRRPPRAVHITGPDCKHERNNGKPGKLAPLQACRVSVSFRYLLYQRATRAAATASPPRAYLDFWRPARESNPGATIQGERKTRPIWPGELKYVGRIIRTLPLWIHRR